MASELENKLRLIVQPALNIIEMILKRKGLGDSNLLKLSKVVIENNRLVVLMPQYADFVDAGRKAGGRMPPVSAIVSWIREKNIKIPNAYTIDSFAYIIGRSIAKKGIKPRRFYDEMTTRLTDLIFDYTNKLITAQINKI